MVRIEGERYKGIRTLGRWLTNLCAIYALLFWGWTWLKEEVKPKVEYVTVTRYVYIENGHIKKLAPGVWSTDKKPEEGVIMALNP